MGALMLAQSLLLSAESLDYAGWKSRAEQLLGQHRSERSRNVTTPGGQKDKAAQAGEAWLAAARQCQDPALRFQALEQAALAFAESHSSVGNAQEQALTEARDLTQAPAADRARVALRLARVTRQRADLEVACGLAAAAPELRGEAYHELALSYLLEAKKDPALHLPLAENYEKSAAAYAGIDPGRAGVELGQAQLAAEKIVDRKRAVATLDRLYQTQLGYSNQQSPLGQAMVKLRWADALERLERVDRAQELRRELGQLALAPLDQRQEAWMKASEAEVKRKQPAQAWKDLEQARLLRLDNYVYSEKIAHKQIEILYSMKNLEGIAAAWQQLAAHPKASPQQRDENRMKQVRWLRELKHHPEADALLDAILAAPGSPPTLARACELKVEARLDARDYAGALQEIERLLPRLPQPATALLDLKGRCWAAQGKEAEALEFWEKLHRHPSGSIVPSNSMITAVESIYREHLAARRLEAAAALKTRARNWVVQPILNHLWEAEYSRAAGDPAAARAALDKARAQLSRFSGSSRAQLEKRIQDLAGQL
jgi:hypothetical protein